MVCFGAEWQPNLAASQTYSERQALTSSVDGAGAFLNLKLTHSVWPSMTGTALHCADTFNWSSGNGANVKPSRPMSPKIFLVSDSIFSSSPAINGTMLSKMSIPPTPGEKPAPEIACNVVVVKMSKGPNLSTKGFKGATKPAVEQFDMHTM